MINHRIELVAMLPQNSVVAEIGVAEGNFSCDLLDAGVGTLYSVDAWKTIDGVTGDGNFPQGWHDINYSMAARRLKAYKQRSFIIREMSILAASKIADNTLDMVYLDAGHYYDAVLSDLTSWYAKVKSGGIIAGHDYLNQAYGVNAAVGDFIKAAGLDVDVIVIPENNPADASFYFIKP